MAEMVNVPLDSLPEEWKQKHLVKEEELVKGNNLPKRQAAIEVVRVLLKMQTLATVAVIAIWVTLLGSYIYSYIAIVGAIAGSGFIGFILFKARNEIDYLKKAYKI